LKFFRRWVTTAKDQIKALVLLCSNRIVRSYIHKIAIKLKFEVNVINPNNFFILKTVHFRVSDTHRNIASPEREQSITCFLKKIKIKIYFNQINKKLNNQCAYLFNQTNLCLVD